MKTIGPYDYVIASAEESLRNLRLPTIDLLQLHVWSDAWEISAPRIVCGSSGGSKRATSCCAGSTRPKT